MKEAPTVASPRGGPYAWFVVAVLILAYTMSFIDRQILTLMVGPIRETLDISDTQISLLHGLAFALFYTIMGIPIGRLVDRRRRTVIIGVGVAVWSAMTMACGLARNFGQLFLARIGVGVGEAALSPGAYSMLSDYFPPEKLARALSVYTSATHVGAGLATIVGGALITLVPAMHVPVLGALEPWQIVFLAVGAPGLLVALLVLALREPPRHDMMKGDVPAFRTVLAYLMDRRGAYGLLILGYAVAGIFWNGIMAWLPTFFIRRFDWTPGEVGLRFGLSLMAAGIIGVLAGGMIASAMRARGRIDANVRIGLISLAIATPMGVIATQCGDGMTALLFVSLFLFGCAMPWGAAAAALQEITPNQMRGQVSAIYLFCLSLIGTGLGPTLVAALTDHMFGRDDAIHLSMAVTMLIAAPLAALLLGLALHPYRLAMQHRIGRSETS